MSGTFENVTFNIPNPEVRQSFDTALPQADAIQADLILSTDPDADRIGVMVNHHGVWEFLNGNEIGILTDPLRHPPIQSPGHVAGLRAPSSKLMSLPP